MTPRDRMLAAVHQRRFGRMGNPIPGFPMPGLPDLDFKMPPLLPGPLGPAAPVPAAPGGGGPGPGGGGAPPVGPAAPGGGGGGGGWWGGGWGAPGWGGGAWPYAAPSLPAVQTSSPAAECSYDPDDGTVTCAGSVYRATVVDSGKSATGAAMVLLTSPAFAGSRWVEVAPKRLDNPSVFVAPSGGPLRATTWSCPDGTRCKSWQACKCSGCNATGCGPDGKCECIGLAHPDHPSGLNAPLYGGGPYVMTNPKGVDTYDLQGVTAALYRSPLAYQLMRARMGYR